MVVPARAGSKGLPGKNVRRLAGLPLFIHSVNAALEMKRERPADDVRIVVSSDHMAICQAAADCGRGVMGLVRPSELATDTAATDAVLLHVLQVLQLDEGYRPDLVVLLQPTVPLRRPGLVSAAIARLVDAGADSLLTAHPLHFVWWREPRAYTYTDGADATGGATPPEWTTQCRRRPPRQALQGRELMFEEDGSVFVTRTELLEGTGQRVGGRIEVLETERTVDIDTADDFALAEALFSLRARARGTSEEVA